MKKSNNLLESFIIATGTLIYVSAVALLMSNGKNIFGESEDFLIPLFMLLLFVVSASITGLLVLGRPIHLYLNNFKKEAFRLLFSTLAWLILFLVAVVIVLLLK